MVGTRHCQTETSAQWAVEEAGSRCDLSVALDDPAAYQDIQQQGTAQPDYLMWIKLPQLLH